MSTAGRYVGQRVQRREDARLVTGHGTYVDDVVVPGALHAAFVRSDLAHGRIESVDTSEALGMEGVHAVLLGSDLNPGMHETWFTMVGRDAGGAPMTALAEGDVRYVGDPIALVLAESRYLAEDACEGVWAEVEPLPPVLGMDTAIDETANLVHPELGTNMSFEIPAVPDPELDQVLQGGARFHGDLTIGLLVEECHPVT